MIVLWQNTGRGLGIRNEELGIRSQVLVVAAPLQGALGLVGDTERIRNYTKLS